MKSAEVDPTEGLPTLVIGPAAYTDHDAIAALLTEAGLPVPDNQDSPVHMLAAHADGVLIGCVGWEQHDDYALLRSLAVDPETRGHGAGLALAESLLDVLRSFGVAEVYLLTTSAAGFFAKLGFEPIERAVVPDELQESKEFSLNCCASAQCMKLPLGPSTLVQ